MSLKGAKQEVVIPTVNERWEKGIPHNPKSIDIGRALALIDSKNNDTFEFKFGGDGDNGEDLLFLLDIYFDHKKLKQAI